MPASGWAGSVLRWAGPDPSPSARLELSFSDGNLVAPVNDCRRPDTKTEALAFATALKATRAIDTESRLAPSLIELRVKLP
jgi:hypothetical protein